MNLLPNTEKELVKRGLKLRSRLVLFSFVSLAFLVGLVMLFPSYFLTRGQISLAETSLPAESEDHSEIQNILNLPQEIEAKLKLYQANISEGSLTGYLSKIVPMMPESVVVNSISFARGALFKEKRGTLIILSGTAKERESLIEFSNLLKESGSFSQVDVPISNLTKDRDLPFTMNVFIAN